MANDRPNKFLQLIHRSKRGRLKIYLGYAPGVGKTYEMLMEAHQLKKQGVDVVVGFVETHGRPETAKLLEGLEILPRRRQEYRGIVLEEMDVEAVISRKPEVALVDELAHTNVPGSGNLKRYQDVQDILAAGIHAISTLNIQHIESLYNTVEQLVHVKVKERIPDSVVLEADEIVNVDVSMQDLQERMREGNIYPKERVSASLANFFQGDNLQQLRELTMREIASQLEQKRRENSEERPMDSTPDQVMVALSSRGPNSEALLRYASRLAGKLNRSWYAVYVQTPSEEPASIDPATKARLSNALTLANQLGAIVFTYKGEDVVDTILRFAREYGVGQVVIGRPRELPIWKKLMGKKTVAEKLAKKAKGISLVIVDADLPGGPAADINMPGDGQD